MKYLVTGAAGFIGFHTTSFLLERGDQIVGVDNLNDYYAVSLKHDRLKQLENHGNFEFRKIDIADKTALESLADVHQFDAIIHLAAQAGVRYSIENPDAYINSNIVGFLNILEVARHNSIRHLVYASSSSVYGANEKIPFSIQDKVVQPVSLYGATKASNELMAYAYNHLYNIAMTGLRFFTVYGPWGRPDMAYFKFTKSIINGDSIDVFNNGEHARDFTYIDDIVDGVVSSVDRYIDENNSCKVYNLGNNKPVELMKFIHTLENVIGKKAKLNMLPMQKGDVEKTYADIELSMKELNYSPKTDVATGLSRFVDWYSDYYKD